jgi:hypothetical protein
VCTVTVNANDDDDDDDDLNVSGNFEWLRLSIIASLSSLLEALFILFVCLLTAQARYLFGKSDHF